MLISYGIAFLGIGLIQYSKEYHWKQFIKRRSAPMDKRGFVKLYGSLIKEIANKYRIEPALLAGVIWQESRGRHDAFRFESHVYEQINATGKIWGVNVQQHPYYGDSKTRKWLASSWGLMQIMMPTAITIGQQAKKWFKKDTTHIELLNPKKNMEMGAWYLKQLLNKHKNIRYALAEYNSGAGFSSLGRYDRQVLVHARYFRGVFK